jgi:Ca2+:H+ antiporter
VGEPFGTLVLTLAVTMIEASLIVALMRASHGDTDVLARDTLFAAIMIVCNGIVGICVVVGALRHTMQDFRIEGARSALSVLIALAALSLVLPLYTTTTQGPTYSVPQLAFAAVASLALYAVFLFVQTVRHRDFFLELGGDGEVVHTLPSARAAALSAVLLLACLVSVVGLAKLISPAVERSMTALGAPPASVGIVIAMLVLLPEGTAAVRAALANRLQTSLNLALGSALSSIGLTIPAVAVTSTLLGMPLTLGLDPKEESLLAVTFLVSLLTFATGRTTLLQGAVHLVLFAAYLFLSIVP